MNLVQVCISLTIGAAIAVACSSPSSSGSGGGSGTSSGGGPSGGSGTGSGGDNGCGRYPHCSEPTPVCCAVNEILSCVATGECMGVTTMLGCRPGGCPTDQVCCGTLIGNGVRSTCEASCTGAGVEICDPTSAVLTCSAGLTCTAVGFIDTKTGYCSPTTSPDEGLGGRGGD